MFGAVTEFINNTLHFTLSDIIDILIVAYIIYKAIQIVKETRALQLLKGVAVILLAMQVSEWLQFNAISYILKNTIQLGMLALLVVFQPELRKGLEQVGRGGLGAFFKIDTESSAEQTGEVIIQICDAADLLSRSRTGALIVVERDTKIGDVIRTGTALDAKVSSHLLQNIFYDKSPLHDGAVIIKENKIAAAACYLPLSEDNSISKDLGTRHRAAIGMSEVSDAVVIVVSEETGKIAVALGGDLTRNLTVENLSRALHRLMMPKSEEDKARKSLIVKVKSKWTKK